MLENQYLLCGASLPLLLKLSHLKGDVVQMRFLPGTQAVEMFLDGKCTYLDIARLIEATCDRHQSDLVAEPSLDEIVHYDLWARAYVTEQVAELGLVTA